MAKKKSKAKEIRVAAKARSLKEMFIGGGIDGHDLGEGKMIENMHENVVLCLVCSLSCSVSVSIFLYLPHDLGK